MTAVVASPRPEGTLAQRTGIERLRQEQRERRRLLDCWPGLASGACWGRRGPGALSKLARQ